MPFQQLHPQQQLHLSQQQQQRRLPTASSSSNRTTNSQMSNSSKISCQLRGLFLQPLSPRNPALVLLLETANPQLKLLLLVQLLAALQSAACCTVAPHWWSVRSAWLASAQMKLSAGWTAA